MTDLNETLAELDRLHAAGEVGELCNLIKKAERARLGLKGGSVAPERIAEELADVVICADLVGIALGIDLSEAVRTKFNRTSVERGFRTRLAANLAQLNELARKARILDALDRQQVTALMFSIDGKKTHQWHAIPGDAEYRVTNRLSDVVQAVLDYSSSSAMDCQPRGGGE